jgi:hypothetical protein
VVAAIAAALAYEPPSEEAKAAAGKAEPWKYAGRIEATRTRGYRAIL